MPYLLDLFLLTVWLFPDPLLITFFALSLSRVSHKYDLYIAISKRLAVFAGTVLILPFFSDTLSSTIEGPLIRLKWIKAEVD